MKLKIIFPLILLFIISCKQIKKEVSNTSKLTETEVSEESIVNVKEKKEEKGNYNFNSVIKCQKYDYRPEDIYSWGDYGCLYAPNDNNIYGNLIIYLIPKIGINKYYNNYIGEEDENITFEYNRVNSLSIQDIKKEFHIYLSLIDNKYLKHTPNLDASYNIKYENDGSNKFVTEWYTFNNKDKYWKLLDSFETLAKTDNKAWEWEQAKIKAIIKKYK